MKFVTPLTQEQVETLTQCQKNHLVPRVRVRAATILLSHKGLTLSQIAQVHDTDARRVSSWINLWEHHGLAGLYDAPRSGRPPILLPDEEEQVVTWVEQSPRDLKKVVATVEKETEKKVSITYIEQGLDWKKWIKSAHFLLKTALNGCIMRKNKLLSSV